MVVRESGVRFRKSPDASNLTNVIRELSKSQEVVFIEANGQWFKVSIGSEEGWIRGDFLSPAQINVSSEIKQTLPLVKGKSNLVQDSNTVEIRKIIKDEFGGGAGKDHLNCTEYLQYRIKTKLGVDIKWPADRPRNGGKWGDIFERNHMYKVLSEPVADCAMCFTTGISSKPETNAIGHVAFVEAVLPDGSISISEANWTPSGQLPQGQYNERVLTREKWQTQYRARFVKFN